METDYPHLVIVLDVCIGIIAFIAVLFIIYYFIVKNADLPRRCCCSCCLRSNPNDSPQSRRKPRIVYVQRRSPNQNISDRDKPGTSGTQKTIKNATPSTWTNSSSSP